MLGGIGGRRRRTTEDEMAGHASALSSAAFLKSAESPAEKAMAPHSSTLVWKIPWMDKAMGLLYSFLTLFPSRQPQIYMATAP